DYKPAGSIIRDLVDIVSKNGCLLLNVAPKPDGTIPEEQRKILLNIGEWLKINGEAIYGSRTWIVYGEGPTKTVGGEFKEEAGGRFTGRDIRFTSQGDTLYAIFLDWPGSEAEIKSLSTLLTLYPDEIGSVEMLGVEEQLQWTRNENGLRVKMPERKPCEHAYTLKINRLRGKRGG
ncbi:MAG: alpha-L-fucosidase, partial [Candidatus Bathyarchaeia archaeon]